MTAVIATADVAVVGCGIIGLAAAERLTARGLSVVAVDESGVAAGSTGASGGLVRALDLAGRPGSWAAQGLDRYLRQGWHGTWPAVREHGSLTLVDADGLPGALAGVAAVRAAGQDAQLLSAQEISARFTDLSVPDGFTGVYEPRAGWLPVAEVATAMRRDAGPALQLVRAKATGVLTSAAGVCGVRTTEGTVRARAVLLAAGVGSAPLAASVGVPLALCTRSVSYCLFQLDQDSGATGLPTVADATTGAWLRRWNRGRTVLAGVVSQETGVPATVRGRVSADEQRRVREVVRHRCPGLADAPAVGGLAAYDAMVVGGQGAVTDWPSPGGLVTAVGWNGNGFKLAPAVGELAADRLYEMAG